jgi:ABC-type nitrate/sulfonate/bicarbonate transport system permease component
MKTPFRSTVPVGVLGYAASVAVILALWQYGSSKAIIPLLFPSPLNTWRTAVQLLEEGRLLNDVVASLSRIGIGFTLGSLLGIVLGVLMGSFRTVRLIFEPYVQFLRSLPALAWIPAAMLWFGTGEESKVLLLIYTTVFVVALNTMIGVSSVPENQLRAARCFGASPWRTFYMVKAPATVGYMLTGMRLAMGNCFSTIIAAELLAPESGLGYLIFSSRTWMQTEFAFVGIVILGLLGFLVDRVFHVTTTRLCARFLPE